MNMPLVSIIMPTYNRRYIIGDAIDSCLRQTYTNFELIICDDHSTDGTMEYIRDRMREDARIKFCKNPDGKKGTNAARNTAIRMAGGIYLIFLDSDDYLLDDSLEVRVKFFEKQHAGLVYGNVYGECNGRRSKWIFYDLKKEKINQRKFLMENLALCCQISFMVRAEVFNHIGMLDENQKAWTDDEIVVAVGMRYPVVHCGKFVSVARTSTVSMRSNKWNMYTGCRTMVRRYKKEIIRYASLRRYLLWKIRLFSAYCYAKETECNHNIPKIIWKILHESVRDVIKPYFKWYCE